MDESTFEKHNKIFEISNYIYRHTKGLIDYTSIKSIIISHVGLTVTVTQEEFNNIKQKVLFLKDLIIQLELTITHIKSLNENDYITFIKSNDSIFDTYLQDFNYVFEEIKKDIICIRNKGFIIPMNKTEAEKTIEGTNWLYTLFDFYIKYKGKRLVSAIDFFYHIRKIWGTVEDKETIEISNITDNILGGVSILNISHNLKDWISKNYDIIKRDYKDIVDYTASIEPKYINTFEIIEFIPEYTFTGEIIFDDSHFKLEA